MTTPNLQVRRATIEDFPKLTELWAAERLPAEALQERFKEFQVVAADDGELRGALGLQIEGMEGCLHSEAFAHPEEADHLRELLLQRMQIMAANHGLYRLWTQLNTPFWHANGFREAPADTLAKRPATFCGDNRPWQCLQLKEEPAGSGISLEKEFALFKESEKERTEKIYRQARVLKIIATLIAAAVFLLIIVSLTIFFLKKRGRGHRLPGPDGARPAPVLAAGWMPADLDAPRGYS